MTASDVTGSDQRVETWKPIPGCTGYEASDNSVWRLEDGKPIQVSGGIRSIDRMSGRRQLKGVVLKGRLNNSGYVLVNVTSDEGRPVTVTAHRLILLAHRGECPPGMETLHDPQRGPLWCRIPEDMRYGTREENLDDWRASNPPRPKPIKSCVRCSGPFEGNGKRCHPCVVTIGEDAAMLLRGGMTLSATAIELDYPSLDGLHTLAVKHGGYGIEQPRWTQRVTTTLRRLCGGGDRP